jgi:hypothetical protein
MIALVGGAATVARAIDNADCLACHGEKDLVKTNALGKVVSLFVDEKVFKTSIHRTNACTACHADIKDLPHEKVAPVNCASCHAAVGKEYATSIHGVSRAMGS